MSLRLEAVPCRIHGGLRRGAGSRGVENELLERRQRAAVERRGQNGAAGVGNLGVVEAEHLELGSTPAVGDSAPAGGVGGATRAARPSSPNRL